MGDKKTNTTQQILNVALDLFAERGFHGTSMREIADGVGIRQSSIYNHFSGKKEILKQLFLAFGPATIKEELTSKKLKNKISQPYEFLQSFVQLIIKELSNEQEQKFLQVMLREHTNKVVRKAIKEKLFMRNRKLIADAFEQMMKQELIKEGDPLDFATEFIGPLIFLRLEYLLSASTEEDLNYLQQSAQRHVEFFWQAIKKE